MLAPQKAPRRTTSDLLSCRHSSFVLPTKPDHQKENDKTLKIGATVRSGGAILNPG